MTYPRIIMGEDHFTGWFKKCKEYLSEEERAQEYNATLEMAYSLGVRGFSMSPHDTLINVLKNFKQKHPDIICIANYHWKTNYYIDSESLWEEKNMKKLVNFASSKIDKEMQDQCYWFKETTNQFFTPEEVAKFRLNEEEYTSQLKKFDFCDFCLVGDLGISSLILHERVDIIEKEVELVRKAGKIPLLMAEGGGLALPTAEKLDVFGSWLCINRSYVFPNFKVALNAIKKSTKPITAYKILTSPDGFDLEKSINFIKTIPQINSIVVGVDGANQAKETFTRLKEFWK
jgi:hypothetical protein